MPYAGKQLMARDVAREARKYWTNYELTKAVATAIAESHLFLGAYHDNTDNSGTVTSRDCGIYEFNIPASEIGTDKEFQFRTESKDPAVWTPVFEYSVKTALDYYNAPWERNGKQDIRRWQAWAAYTSGWATFPYAWVWHHDLVAGTCPGPWVKTGRYIFQAIAGQMNNLVVNEKIWSPQKALFYAQKYSAHFNINDGSEPYLTQDKQGNTIVSWKYAPMPTKNPTDCGPYPVQNDGV